MKTLLLALAFMAVVPAMAVEENDTTIQYRNKQIVVKTDSVETKIVLLDKDGNEYVKSKETTFVDGQEVERVFISSPFVPVRAKRGRTFYANLPDFYIGTNLLNGGTEAHSRDSRSLEWGMTFFDMGLAFDKSNNFGLVTAFQIGFVHNHFDTKYVLDNVNDGATLVENKEMGVRTSFMKYNYFKVPVMLEWKKKFGHKTAFIAAGLSGELRSGFRSKYRIGKTRHTVSRNLNVNPLGVNLEAYIGFSRFNIYAHYALTSFFRKGINCHPLGIGVGIKL